MAPRLQALALLAAVAGLVAGCGTRGSPAPGPCRLEFSDRGDARVFVVGHHLRLEDAADYQRFEASFRRHLEDISPCLSDARPNLLLFPEDSGLVAWFIGRQGLLARGSGDSGTAFNALYAQHYRASDEYRRRFPGISAARALTLAGGDVAWRAIEKTFGGIARELGAWVITSANLPQAHHSREAADAILGDPDAHDGAYVASGPELYNSALLYGPDGKLAGRVDKVYLTDPEEQVLDLSSGSLEKLAVFELPFARIGAAISRDAFYPPFLQRLEDLGVELVVQPEAWAGWTVEEHPGDWLPDVILASGYSHTQKYRGFRHSAAPMLTGNLFDFYFDGQVWITQKAEPGLMPRGFVGSEPLSGFAELGPWAFAEEDPQAPLSERRERLRVLGKRLLPGSSSAEEGRYIDSLVAADLSFYGEGRAAPPKPVTATSGGAGSVLISGAGSGNQTNPDAAYDDAGTLYAVWSDSRGGIARLYFASSLDDGATWSPARPVDDRGTEAQLRPSIAAGGAGRLIVAWQERTGGIEQIRVASSMDAGSTFSTRWLEPSAAAQWEPDVAIGPGGQAALAWTDFRGGLAPKVRLACQSAGGHWGASRMPDDTAAELPRAQGSQLQPSIASSAAGRVALAWIDYRGRDWQVFASIADGCDELGPGARVGEESEFEVLASDPQLAPGAGSELALTWDDLRERRGHHDLRAAWVAAGTTQWTKAPQWTGGADSGVNVSRFRPSGAFLGPSFRVVFQDLSAGKNGLSYAELPPGATLLPAPQRFDDTGASANQLTRPRAVSRRDGARGAVLFEDDRDGWSRVRSSALR